MTQNQQDAISSTISSQGWVYVENMLVQEIVNPRKPAYLKTDGKTAEQIAIEVKAAEMACNAVRNALNKVKRAGGGAIVKKEKFV